MQRRKLLVGLAANLAPAAPSARGGESERIQNLLHRLTDAVRAKDLSRVLECYSRDGRILVFDLQGRYAGPAAVRDHWQEVLGSIQGPMQFELSEVAITADASVAYVHCLEHVLAVKKGQPPIDMTVRNTRGLRKIDGRWAIEHEHVSLQMA